MVFLRRYQLDVWLTYTELYCGLDMLPNPRGWMDGWMDRGFPQELPTRCLVGVRRATLWTRGFGSMSRAEMASMDRAQIFSGRTQSNTVDSGIWQHVEGRDGIRLIVDFLRHYQPDVWKTVCFTTAKFSRKYSSENHLIPALRGLAGGENI
ncbi:hypothetical protein C0J52_17511 [Blattella germanica]|nr:hypothetical protein C0J52_17511 [Blattella germanica]